MTRLVPFLLVSALIHVGIMTGFDSLRSRDPVVAGHDAGSQRQIFVTLVEDRQQTAESETPESADSAPSQAANLPDRNETDATDQPVEPPPPEEVVEPERAEKPENQEMTGDHRLLARAVQDTAVDLSSGPEGLQPERTGDPEPPTPDHMPVPKEKIPEKAVEEPRTDKTGPERTKSHDPKTGDEDVVQKLDMDEPPDAPTESEKPTKTASKASQAAQQSARSSFMAASGHDLPDLRASILAAIREACYYPRKALRKRISGRALVKFTILRDGRVEIEELVRSSGSKLLDDAATRIVRKAARNFPSIPESSYRERISYVVPIDFKPRQNPRK